MNNIQINNYDENNDLELIKRRLRGFTQRILLLDIIKGENNDIYFKILGSKNDVYTIHIWLDVDILKCDCSCPDKKYRGVECKHILWLSVKKFGKLRSQLWNVDDINNFYFNWYSVYHYPRGRNDICPICLEGIDSTKENIITCVNSCNNSVHSFCWNKYYIISKKTKCVICRKFTMPFVYD